MSLKDKLIANANKIQREGLSQKYTDKGIQVVENANSELTKLMGGGYKTHIRSELVSHILELYDGNLKGLNVVDIGCGGKEYAPVLSYALANLGAKVIGMDAYHPTEEVKSKEGFKFNKIDLNHNFEIKYFEPKFEKANLIIANSFLSGGLRNFDYGPITSVNSIHGDVGEWNKYVELFDRIKDYNTKSETLYVVEKPVFNFMFTEEFKKLDEDQQENYIMNKVKEITPHIIIPTVAETRVIGFGK